MHHQKYIEHLNKLLKEQEISETKYQKYRKAHLTYDHNGEFIIIKGFNKTGEYDFYNPDYLENIANTVNQANQPNVKDMGIVDKRLMLCIDEITKRDK